MARVEQAAQIAFAQDVGAGRAKLTSSAPTPSAAGPSRKPPPKPSNPFTNYSTAKSLGYDDPDAERLAAEAERRRAQGVAGEWEMVAPSSAGTAPSQSASDAGVKRSAEALDEEESREYKLRKKTVTTGLGQIYDPGAITITLKKKEEPVEHVELVPALAPLPVGDPTNKPKWGKLQWKKMGEPAEEPDERSEISNNSAPKLEEVDGAQRSDAEQQPLAHTSEALDAISDTTVKPEPFASPLPETLDPVVFKKRKIPAAGAGGRRRGM